MRHKSSARVPQAELVVLLINEMHSGHTVNKKEGNGNPMEAKKRSMENKTNVGDDTNNKNVNSADDRTEKREAEKQRDEKISEYGQTELNRTEPGKRIHLLSIIGEIEGHECSAQNMKTTKYEHVLPQLAQIEDDKDIGGLLVLLNTVGGDVESGLAIAEMIASLSKPTVSLVLGGGHSIGVPLAVSTDYSFIVPTGTMIVHPVRMSGMVIGAPQTYEYFRRIQDRITGFVASHSNVRKERIEEMMLKEGELTKDLGTILVGEDAVKEGFIDEVGGIQAAMKKIKEMMK